MSRLFFVPLARLALPIFFVTACSAVPESSPPPTDPSRTGGATGTGGSPGSGGSPPGTGGAAPTGTGGQSPAGSGGSGAGGSGTGGSGMDAAVEAASPADAPSATGLVKIFDGTSFDNWQYDPKAWTLKDGAMVGKTGGGQSQAFTKKDYANFRLIVSSRMVNGNDHLGICLWGSRPNAGYGFGGCLLVIPPNAAIWDYLTNKDNPKPNYQVGMAEWHKTEILANLKTGKVLVAVNGKLLHEYQDSPANLARRKTGPVGMQIHKAGTESEYKDIEIEVDPVSDKLITLTP